MELENVFDVASVDEVIDLPVRVASDVGEHAPSGRPFVEPMDGHYREELLDRPGVGQRLEYREVAEVRVRELAFERLQLLGNLVHLARDSLNFLTQRPEDVFGADPLGQGQVPEGEQGQALFLVL